MVKKAVDLRAPAPIDACYDLLYKAGGQLEDWKCTQADGATCTLAWAWGSLWSAKGCGRTTACLQPLGERITLVTISAENRARIDTVGTVEAELQRLTEPFQVQVALLAGGDVLRHDASASAAAGPPRPGAVPLPAGPRVPLRARLRRSLLALELAGLAALAVVLSVPIVAFLALVGVAAVAAGGESADAALMLSLAPAVPVVLHLVLLLLWAIYLAHLRLARAGGLAADVSLWVFVAIATASASLWAWSLFDFSRWLLARFFYRGEAPVEYAWSQGSKRRRREWEKAGQSAVDAAEPPAGKACPRCSEVLEPAAPFCRHCGHLFSVTEVAEARERARALAARAERRARRAHCGRLGWILSTVGGVATLLAGLLLYLSLVVQVFGGAEAAETERAGMGYLLVCCLLPWVVAGLALLLGGLFSFREASRAEEPAA